MHHANIVINKEDSRDFVFDILIKNLAFDVKANPDFLLVENQSFGINDARNLEQWALGKPLMGKTKVFLIITKAITHEAQNALLKVLEEPPIGTYIFINLENLGGLLPTFLSRVMVLNVSKNSNDKNIDAHKFFSSGIKEKLIMIRSLAKKEDKNDMKKLIKDLEEISYKKKASAEQMRDILTAKIFASARGSSPKILLEWLSGVL